MRPRKNQRAQGTDGAAVKCLPAVREHPATLLGRACADAGMNRLSAMAVFRATYTAAAVTLAGGNITKAAERSGVSRDFIYDTLRPARGDAGSGDPETKGEENDNA